MKKKMLDVVKEDERLVGVTVEDTEDRVGWKHLIRCGDVQS